MRELAEVPNQVINGFSIEIWETDNQYEVIPGWFIDDIKGYYAFHSLTERQFDLCIFIAVCRKYVCLEYQKTPEEYAIKAYLDKKNIALFDQNYSTGNKVRAELASGRHKVNQKKKGDFTDVKARNEEIKHRYLKIREKYPSWRHGKTVARLSEVFDLSERQIRTIVGPDPLKK